MASIGDSPPRVNPMPVVLHAELYGAPSEADATLQRDSEARLDVIQNILDQWTRGGVSWRDAVAAPPIQTR
jgi:hypothetical protein